MLTATPAAARRPVHAAAVNCTPWSVLNTTPASGKTYGFVFSISYDNNPGTTHQDAVISNVSTRTLTDPSTWGTLSLTR